MPSHLEVALSATMDGLEVEKVTTSQIENIELRAVGDKAEGMKFFIRFGFAPNLNFNFESIYILDV